MGVVGLVIGVGMAERSLQLMSWILLREVDDAALGVCTEKFAVVECRIWVSLLV